MKFLRLLTVASLALQRGCGAFGFSGRPSMLIRDDSATQGPPLQDVVTWDDKSLFVHGKRVMIFSGEFHPFRLPVPSLWLDVFQKVKALGLNTISFYVHWALLEGKPGEFRAEGVFDLEPFFQAAKDAGMFLIARPGPYINAEVSGGGFPGWLQRVRGHPRTNDSDYLAATENYIANIGRIIAKHQITNGGPVILLQPENEYTNAAAGIRFPNGQYFQHVIDQYRKAGVVVPMISNDASPAGHNAPGTGVGEVDIYGHDGYPLGFDCANPTTWPAGRLPTNWHERHQRNSPNTPYSILEFQGGSFDPPGGPGFENCAALVNHEFERVFYKNNYGAGVTIFNIYMIFGGTNWGNLGHPGGYTSYDYGAALKEDRTITREKYSELKLQAQFLKVSPGYLTAEGGTNTTNYYNANFGITTTPVLGSNGSFFVVRHLNYARDAATYYTLHLPTSLDFQALPKGGGGIMTMGRRDSKVYVTEYPLGGDFTLLYAAVEIFTWMRDGAGRTHLVVYAEVDEVGEIGIRGYKNGTVLEGEGVTFWDLEDWLTVAWVTTAERRVFQIGNLIVYVLDRNSAYNYWVPELGNNSSIIINGGYLVRSASIVSGDTLSISADFNITTDMEFIGVPPGVTKLQINGQDRDYTVSNFSTWVASVPVPQMKLAVPDLTKLEWHYVDSLPELGAGFSDDDNGDDGETSWVKADHTTSNNTLQCLLTPTSLFGSDYGFHAGALVFRGRFNATGGESALRIRTKGGQAFASSVWLDSAFLGSWVGGARADENTATYNFPSSSSSPTQLEAGSAHVLTVVVDSMGLDQNFVVGQDLMKSPRGILDYAFLGGGSAAAEAKATNAVVDWRIAGNLGGEDYADKARGPLNEGGWFAERMGYHLPSPPLAAGEGGGFRLGSPMDVGVPGAGARLFTAKLALALPSPRFDVPVSFAFEKGTQTATTPTGIYRALLFVNGFQFGRYTSNIGPQTSFPVPEGILNYKGDNWVALLVWALEAKGAKVPGFYLDIRTPVMTGREAVELVEAPGWSDRRGV